MHPLPPQHLAITSSKGPAVRCTMLSCRPWPWRLTRVGLRPQLGSFLVKPLSVARHQRPPCPGRAVLQFDGCWRIKPFTQRTLDEMYHPDDVKAKLQGPEHGLFNAHNLFSFLQPS